MEATDLTKNDIQFTLTFNQYIKLNKILGYLGGMLMYLENISGLTELLTDANKDEWLAFYHNAIKTNLKDELEPIVMELREQLYERKRRKEIRDNISQDLIDKMYEKEKKRWNAVEIDVLFDQGNNQE